MQHEPGIIIYHHASVSCNCSYRSRATKLQLTPSFTSDKMLFSPNAFLRVGELIQEGKKGGTV